MPACYQISVCSDQPLCREHAALLDAGITGMSAYDQCLNGNSRKRYYHSLYTQVNSCILVGRVYVLLTKMGISKDGQNTVSQPVVHEASKESRLAGHSDNSPRGAMSGAVAATAGVCMTGRDQSATLEWKT